MIGVGVHLYVCSIYNVYTCMPPMSLNGTFFSGRSTHLFKHFVVDFSSNLYCVPQKLFPCQLNQGFPYIMHTLLYLAEG